MSDVTCFGKELARLREESGYTLAEIAKLTKINVEILRDLENGISESAGGAVYARGHIRTIAGVMGVDPTSLLHLFDENDHPDTRPMIELLEESNATSAKRQKNPISPKFIAIAASVAIGMAILIPSGLALTQKSAHKVAPKKIAKVATKSAPTSSASNSGIVISAPSGETWVSVNGMAGEIIFSGMLKAGTSRSFPTGTVSTIRIGNAGVAALSVDGENYGTLGAIGEVKTVTIAPTAPSAQG